MGPWNEQRQLRRIAAVKRLLEQPNLDAWAVDYWTRVLNSICRDEARYNSRVVAFYRDIPKRATEEWMK